MSGPLAGIDPTLRTRVEAIIADLSKSGFDLRPIQGLRDPWTQARYWRQSRTTAQINAAIASLRKKKAGYLADVLESVGPQNGPAITKALPGFSWHQWGEAVDFAWYVDGVYQGGTPTPGDDRNGYVRLGKAATAAGLVHGGTAWGWDWPHVQLSRRSSPLAVHTHDVIAARIKERWGTQPPAV